MALLALLLGAAGGALLYSLSDGQSPEDSNLAAKLTTTSSTATSTTTTDDPSDTPPGTAVPGAPGGGDRDTGGSTAVGNSIFTASYQSNQDRTTDDFTVEDEWKIRWNVPTGTVTIEVFGSGDDVVEAIDARGQGERRLAEGGTYRVEIGTEGSTYTVVITDGP